VAGIGHARVQPFGSLMDNIRKIMQRNPVSLEHHADQRIGQDLGEGQFLVHHSPPGTYGLRGSASGLSNA
jgi:hypothetical protein